MGEVILKTTHVVNWILTSHNFSLSPFEKLYGHALDYSVLHVFGCTCFVLKTHVERTKLSTKSALCVFLGYGLGQKGYRCFDVVSQKLYVSCRVVFLEHISFFSIPTTLHYLTTSDVIKIDPFDIDDTTPTSVPTLEPVLAPIIDITPEVVLVDYPTTHVQSSPEVMVPLSHIRLSYNRKSTQLPDFVSSYYSSSFVAFVTSIHRLHEPSSYREAICDPLW